MPRLPVLALLACCVAAHAGQPLRYQCDTVMTFGPGPCKGSVAPAQDQATLQLDPDRGTWSSGNLGGALERTGDTFILRQWGAREGRDATLNRASGAFDYRFESGCLVQHQTGTCKAGP